MEQKVIRITVTSAATLPLDSLEPFQGDLKTLGREDFERLRADMISEGMGLTMHVWQSEGHNYIIDGHQRVTALKMMRENEGFTIPDLPVAFIQADSFAGAKRRVLAAISVAGKYTEKSLFEFVKNADIPFDQVVANYSFPSIDMSKFTAMFNINSDPQLQITPAPSGGMGSANVSQLQLFYSTEDRAVFDDLVGRLSRVYGKDNVSDVVLEALRAAVASFNQN